MLDKQQLKIRQLNDVVQSKTVYAVRNKKTGLFSPGGCCLGGGVFSSKPKFWQTTGALKNHLRQYFGTKKVKDGKYVHVNQIPEEWEVVVYNILQTQEKVVSARSVYPEEIDYTSDNKIIYPEIL